MTPPNWITPVGDLAEIKANVPATIGLQAAGAVHYSLAGGELPPGLTLTPYGSITGTPQSATAAVYKFIVNAGNDMSQAARSFALAVVV